ncbi:Aste57867_21015 [Aphanomyces stellatus]|uniref:Aste57867_21015 protein n=1 Tax=Aphanomyces stellatus TaxID=120398 RepID=A0A485LHU9_9STRA|nr:hypothetical protein As57867_020947 [Aphanomyces stellatus]VFT97690.1 Aste57867_21015 [Aphanomyces stellatus]
MASTSISWIDVCEVEYSALMCACEEGYVDIVQMLLDRDDVLFIAKAIDICLLYGQYKTLALTSLWMSGEFHRLKDNDGKLILELCAEYLNHDLAMKLLRFDMPIEIQGGTLVARQNHCYSWTTFMDVTHPIDMSVRQSCVESLMALPEFESYAQELLRELVSTKDKHGRKVIQITDHETRKFLNDRLYFCGRFEIFQGPPVYVSDTAFVVMAYDHGLCSQVFQENRTSNGNLDEKGFITCIELMGRACSTVMNKKNKKREIEFWQAEFRLWDKDGNGLLSKEEFLRYFEQHFGGVLKVAMKFMRNSNEYDREIKSRMRLNSDAVLQQLPSLEQSVFQRNLPTLHVGDISMAEYRHVLVLPAADRSLEDIYLKERPDDNKTKSLLNEVLLGIQVLHAQGLVHGDLKKLNVLRVQNQLKLIDFDAAVRVGEFLGAKYSSGILPPEMFYDLETADDIVKYTAYWGHASQGTSKRKKTQVKGNYVIKSYRDGCDPSALPYSLLKATTAVDIWSFGCMMFQMLCGQELIPSDLNQNVVLDYMHKAATWTDAKLRERIDTFIPDEEAQDLVMRLLVVNPTKRLSATEALNHPYFTGIGDTRAMNAMLKELEHNQEKILSEVAMVAANEQLRNRMQEQSVMEIMTATMGLESEVINGLLESAEVVVPTSFAVLPAKSLTGDSVDVSKITSFLSHLWDTGKKLQAAKVNSVSTIVSELSASDPLYLYLIDEATGEVVVPELYDPVYPIEIPTRDNNSFLLMNLPLIQSTFKSLKKAAGAVGWMQRLHVLPSSEAPKDENSVKTKTNWAKEIDIAIANLSEPTVSYQVLRQALDVNDPVEFVRGAALSELKRFYNEHDPGHTFAGLKRAISNQGRVMWTSGARVMAMEEEAGKVTNNTLDHIRAKLEQTTR